MEGKVSSGFERTRRPLLRRREWVRVKEKKGMQMEQ